MWFILTLGCHAPPPPALSQLSVELVPGNSFTVGGHEYDTSSATWDNKEQFTQQIAQDLVPEVLSVLRIDANTVQLQPGLGGYERVTSPSIEVRATVSPDTADVLAAALGLVAFQWSVLVIHLGEDIRPTTAWGAVRFRSPPDPVLAQDFFLHAFATHPALGGGYSRFGNDLLFLNLRDSQGSTLSGLEDDPFVDMLRRAARSFDGAPTTFERGRPIEAHLVENRWSNEASAGEDYLQWIPDSAEPALLRVQARYLDMLEDHGSDAGWFAKDDPSQ